MDGLGSPLYTAYTLHAATGHECIPTHCPNRFLNHGQSVPRIKGCVRHDLTTAFPLRFLSLYLISGSTVGYLCMSPCMYLTSTHSTFSNAPGQTRVWWTKVCVHPESTIAWCIPLTTLPLCVPRGLREGVRGQSDGKGPLHCSCRESLDKLLENHQIHTFVWLGFLWPYSVPQEVLVAVLGHMA